MRTTVRIDDELYRELKAAAAASGRTVAAVLEDAVRVGVRHARGRAEAGAFSVTPFGGSGVLPGIDLTSNAGLYEALDGDTALDALR